MIKGVNRNIIEINNTDSLYFEKAVFYLRPNVRELPAPVSDAEVRKYIEKLGIYSVSPRRRFPFGRFAVFVFLIAAAALSAAAFFL